MNRKLALSTERVFTTVYGSGLSLEHLSHSYLVHKLKNPRASHIASQMPSLKHSVLRSEICAVTHSEAG